jgi:beta-glucosidase
VNVSNASDRDAVEVVQLYLHQRQGSAARPVRELKAFHRVTLPARSTEQVRFVLGPEARRYWSGATREYVLDKSVFDIWVGGASTAELTTTFEAR